MKSALRAVLGVALLSAATAPRAPAQVPPPSQAQAALQQAVQQQPGLADVLRQRIQQSGLTTEQIRARLQASGYPPSLLDAYLGMLVPGQAEPVPGAQEVAAVQALGLPAMAGASQVLPVDTGLVRTVEGGRSAVFGVDVFRRTTTQFLPLLSGPVPRDYKLGPGDVLVVILTGEVELAHTLQITREGFVLIPQVGQVFLSNLTLGQARDVLRTRLGRVYSGVRGPSPTVQFDVSVANVRANQVYVVGEIAQPGAYQLSSLGTVLTALYAAGGITERANMRDIRVERLGKRVATLDLYDYLLRGDVRSDIRLETGDVVFVPVHRTRVQVAGAVIRPAIYELKPGQQLADLIDAAGGFRADAALKRLSIQRVVPAQRRGQEAAARTVINVELADSLKIPSVALEDGDVVVVDALPDRPESYFVTVVGMVNKPGSYPWRAGITLRDVMTVAGGPRVGVDLREAEIARLPADRSQGQLAVTVRVPLDSSYLIDRDSAGRYRGAPGLAFAAGGTAAEVPLEPFDNVLILRQPDFELQRTVDVYGQVRFPGPYALKTKNDRLVELLNRAGGLTPQAYPEGIRFIRPTANAGRINIDLPRALRDQKSRDNVTLQPGDSIFIPEYLASVKVVGAVNSPGSVLYRRGGGLDYYLRAAGGFAYTADEGRISVRYANGEVRTPSTFLFFKSKPQPGPGSEVLVPTKDLTRHTDYVALFGAIAQIVASTVAIIVVAKR
jgi:polysaccharide biosynthesis/export protein